MTLHSASAEPGRRSWWKRFKGWFTRRRPPAPTEPWPVTHGAAPPNEMVFYRPSTPGAPIAAMARDEVYEFQVHTDLEWSTSAMGYDELTRQADEFAATAGDDVRRRVWRVARTFDAHEAAAAEKEMRRQLSSWCYTSVHGEIRCTPTVRVVADQRIRDHLTPFALRRIDLDTEAELARRRADLVKEVVKHWHDVLVELGVSPITLTAAQLTDTEFAVAISRLADRRRASAVELVDVLRQATRDHEQLGMFEFAEMYASAVAAFRRQMEIEDSAFVDKLMDLEPGEQPR
ncbi:hypothetical protein DFJ67_5876 [Asanoa ferruginea]|uniref:Uncharacterized protein n=1 Tax=Asanoa ferruginea TaxID=53367 RepID=A0A3D9ZTP4_9ACTN|nr:hypothetical protein [Asanoa ferruginea]REF99832.1 hypothetical protein DFJ67_5876 [Asanoa ferruginea]GIF51850.1 hypothetical protein Afe04nite_63890 [Asanoa ferruginea]